MKYKGYLSDAKARRDKDLYNLYKRLISQPDIVSFEDVVRQIYSSSAPRFYVGVERATTVVRAIRNGGSIMAMFHQRQLMYTEIYKRYLLQREAYPELSDEDIVAQVIHQDAPSFYMTEKSIRQTIAVIRKSRRNEHKK